MYPFLNLIPEIEAGWEEQIKKHKYIQSMQMSEAEQCKDYFPSEVKGEFKGGWNADKLIFLGIGEKQ